MDQFRNVRDEDLTNENGGKAICLLCQNLIPVRTIEHEEQKEVNKLIAKRIACHFRAMAMFRDLSTSSHINWAAWKWLYQTAHNYEPSLLALLFLFIEESKMILCAVAYITLCLVTFGQVVTAEVRKIGHWTFASSHNGRAITAALNDIMKEWELSKLYCTKLLRDGDAHMISAADLLNISSMACLTHLLHLVVAGAIITKMHDQSEGIPAWAVDVDDESAEPIVEHYEDEQLSRQDR
ncbi:Zinc finger BED domain containing hypothetical protein 4-like [Phytophthora palmivora]|uniref:Uncharacterized protein n=1 Tax=Phytophthora palmivora TaxID=4796 RepID=A0A2P4YD62_9STRA|nr:Zinc finger BED domain containing hypothetical protein 4-like [Phytophthora palmivora]